MEQLTGYIDQSARSIDERKQHLWDDLRDMDFAEKAHFRHEVDLSVRSTEHAATSRASASTRSPAGTWSTCSTAR
ncbi:hypothetical protein [Bounagaea algeriensis]